MAGKVKTVTVTVNCITCLIKTARMRAADGPVIILGDVVHSTYTDSYRIEWLTCWRRAIGFRVLLYDAAIRAMRGLEPRPTPITHGIPVWPPVFQ